VRVQGFDKTGKALIWLLVPFTATAVVAFIQALREGWDIGDTIGLTFFAIFATASIYEILRRKRRKDSTQ
jgi:cbb3-type cytochrome oxidase subunit 3